MPCQRIRKDENAGPQPQDGFLSGSIGGVGGEDIVKPGESGDRPCGVAFRQYSEHRVELRANAKMARNMSQSDDFGAD